MQFLQSLPVSAQTIGLLLLSNVFMTFAWYGHLKNLATSPWYIAALLSWGIALFEYLLQVPGNRIGFTQFSVGQLKIMQEVITLTVFVPFAVFYLHEPLKLDYLWAALVARCTSFFAAPETAPLRWGSGAWRRILAVNSRQLQNCHNFDLIPLRS
jgi:uncharacterized protein